MEKLLAEWWAQLWPNMFAVSIPAVLVFVWHHRSLKKHITKEVQNGSDRSI